MTLLPNSHTKSRELVRAVLSKHGVGGTAPLPSAVKIPDPHPAQRVILDDPARYKVACCGRRFGKSDLIVHMLAYGNGPHTQGALHGLPMAYFSLSYKFQCP